MTDTYRRPPQVVPSIDMGGVIHLTMPYRPHQGPISLTRDEWNRLAGAIDLLMTTWATRPSELVKGEFEGEFVQSDQWPATENESMTAGRGRH